ncbi:MAG: autotransporter domain-containing protein, partial [Alphaproteobacteria bacterium]|nr:autotransporter domain-containing protein [Alphaproteobacteria bacterium]
MTIKRILSFFVVAVISFAGTISSAQAVSFADYVYQNVRRGNVKAVKPYLAKGYSIDAVNPEGMSALCQAVVNKDYITYQRLRQLGASSNKDCMKRVDNRVSKSYEAKPVVQSSAATTTTKVSSSDHTTAYVVGGVLAAGAVAALALSGSGGGSHKHKKSSEIICNEGEAFVNGKCVSTSCPEGKIWNGSECEDIECPENYHLSGNDCVPDDVDCPVGTRLVNGKCQPIECPPNTHLIGNLCVADDDVEIDEEENDGEIYGIGSEDESIFNLFSSPSYPDDEASILLKNKGNADVYGMYGYSGEVFNSYVVGTNNGFDNPKPVGTGNITIEDEGNGTVYGMYSHIADITQYKEAINASAWNNGTAYSNIDITHSGGGKTYGLAGDVRAYNSYSVYGGSAYGNINIKGDGDLYGIYGYVAAVNAVTPFYGQISKGDINIHSDGNGDVYGLMINKDNIPGAGAGDQNLASWFAFNAYSGGGDVEGTINIYNKGNGNVYGMYGGQQLYNAMSYSGTDEHGNPNNTAIGKINILNFGNGNVYGMYLPESDNKAVVVNVNQDGSESYINLTNTGSGVVTGMRGGRYNTITNSGEININNLGSGTAVGIYGEENSRITNSGVINIKREAFIDEEDGLVHQPASAVGGTAYGIYAESGAAVLNSGTINITNAANGAGIYLESGATLENSGTVKFNGAEDSIQQDGAVIDIYNTGRSLASVNLSSFGKGKVILGQGGQFFADSISGDMDVSEKVVQDGFDNQYVVSGALQANNIEQLNLASKSALFTAGTAANDDSGFDVVLERKNFDEVLKDKSAAQFLEQNYQAQNNEELYNYLKSAENKQVLNERSDNVLGKDLLPGFREENTMLHRQFNRQFSDYLFNYPSQHYMGGYKYLDISRDAHGGLTGSDATAHAAYGMVKGRASNGITYGLGATVAQLKSDYDNHSTRKSNTFGLWLPVGYNFRNGTTWFSKAYAGYEDGSYDRRTGLEKYSSDLNSYQYGLSNELRHDIGLGGGFNFTPTAELNLLGMHQDGFDEGRRVGAVHSQDIDSLSLEGGLGAYLSKSVRFSNNHQLGIQIGGIYYVEFLDPDDDITASMSGMAGKYKIVHDDDDTRGVVALRVNYNYKNMMLYGRLEKETNNS